MCRGRLPPPHPPPAVSHPLVLFSLSWTDHIAQTQFAKLLGQKSLSRLLKLNLSVFTSGHPSILPSPPLLFLPLSWLQGQWVCPQRGLPRKSGVEGRGMLTSVFDQSGGYDPLYSTWSTPCWPCGPTPSGETSAAGAQTRLAGKVWLEFLHLFQLFLLTFGSVISLTFRKKLVSNH